MAVRSAETLQVGDILDVTSFEVEAGKIREFALATRAEDKVYRDPDTASEIGFSAVPATPTHVVVAGHYRDQQGFVSALGLAIERVVVGSVEWDYARPLLAGDRLTGTRRIIDDTTREGKRGGVMRMVTLETTWVDDTGAVAVTQREVLIERGA